MDDPNVIFELINLVVGDETPFNGANIRISATGSIIESEYKFFYASDDISI